jgi:peptide deformylase
MKTLNDLLLLGDPRLYEVSMPVEESDLPYLETWIADLDNVMNEIREKYHFGRAIAAPQLGIMKRLIYMNIESPVIILNPAYTSMSEEKFEVWDDCMCLPDLLVKVERHKEVSIKYLDENWQSRERVMEDDLAELFQHEYDHLEGILCTMRAIDSKSFRWRVR